MPTRFMKTLAGSQRRPKVTQLGRGRVQAGKQASWFTNSHEPLDSLPRLCLAHVLR